MNWVAMGIRGSMGFFWFLLIGSCLSTAFDMWIPFSKVSEGEALGIFGSFLFCLIFKGTYLFPALQEAYKCS
jgi:hypothetical protein